MNEDLPSINDFIEDTSQLPSLNEEVESELPSVEDFIEKEEKVLTEEVQPLVVENTDNSTEVIVQLIETVRNSIPEVKSYDKELYELMNLIEEVRKEIPVVPEPPEMPEVRYYDDQISDLQESIVGVRDSIPEVPEVRYYDEQISQLQESIEEVKERDIPDFRWISKSFSVINEDFDNLSDTLATLKGRLDLEVGEIVESIDVSKFETGVDVKRLDESITSTREEITNNLSEVKEKIYEQLRDASLRIWNLNKEFKADDKALKKKVDEEYKKLKVDIEESIKTSDSRIDKLNEYYGNLVEEVSRLPEVKYYDKEIDKVNQSISSVKNLVEVLENKLNKKIAGLKESILVVPPTENNTDPLTPLDQNFATLDDLSNHYRLFLNRIQTQLATLGGGGENNTDGFEYVSDKNLESNPIALVADTWTKVTNDGTSSSTKRQHLPEGITRIYDTSTDRIKLDQLPTNGWLIFRFGVKVIPNVDNVTLKARVAYTLPDGFKFYLQAPGALLNDGAGIEYEEQFTLTFYVGDQDTKDGYGELEVRADGTCSITDCAFMTIVG